MAKKRQKRKRKPAGRSEGASTSSSASSASSGGGVMQSLRSGFQRAAGVGDGSPEEKPSTLSNVLWALVLAAGVGFLLYRYFG